MTKFAALVTLIGCMLLMPLAPVVAQNNNVVIGVNLVNAPSDLTPEEQETILKAMNEAGVRVIRASIPANDKGIDFAKRVYSHGIKIVWLLGLIPTSGTQWPRAPQGFNGMWEDYPLSKADPDQFRMHYASFFSKLEENGVVLAALELGNEINWAGFNADFSLPGQGRVLNSGDLLNDPEGQQVAKGFQQYLKSLAVLKDMRDHSKLNKGTPIISAGLADMGGSSWPKTVKADAVDIEATLDFLRANGLDKLVDGYGLHSYPPAKNPGNAEGAAVRLSHLKQNGLSECQKSGSLRGKPCWFSEWGFNIDTGACPISDTARTALVHEMRGLFSQLATDGRLKGMFFYTWQGKLVGGDSHDPFSAFLCGSLTESGRLAIAPM